MIAIVDYGVGNLASLEAALHRAGAEDVRVTRSHVDILAAKAVVLPGVGRFAVVADPHGAVFIIMKGNSAEGPRDAAPGTPGHVGWRELHAGDVCVPVDPATIADRLRDAGFVEVEVEIEVERESPARRFRFAARAPMHGLV